ncbi:MAG: glycosyltransferase family 2 protein [Deltaproteobacteria bacterium]|nr:glycosyltransferase family 2 protein [Candidatus Anaeroferrophillus wilburensis]MBN2889507.1 glycosyltransferase family 2 protein [Deltaproteobacteria bacterium]
MFEQKTIAVVIPAYNEEKLIAKVVATMPSFVDHIVIVDDCSTDATVAAVKELEAVNGKVLLLAHERNQGVGGAIATGYKWARDQRVEVTAVMAADFQMDPADLPRIVGPVCRNECDYTKGNRLFRGESWEMIPKYRYIGNSFLSLFTKIASGYWHIADSQSGYTAISLAALERIDLDGIYPRYGMPNDLLIKLNIGHFRVRDVSIRPVYNVGEQSGIKVRKVLFTIPWLLTKGFWRRMFEKYVIRDFHPLIFFYLLGFAFGLAFLVLAGKIFYQKMTLGFFPPTATLATMFAFIAASQFILFAMWFDMENGKELK